MYFTVEDFKKEFTDSDLVLDEQGEVDVERMNAVIQRTCVFVDSYLRAAQLNTPVSDQLTVDIIKGPALDIARYFAWADAPTEAMTARYEQAVGWLKDVSNGKVRIHTQNTESRKGGFHNVRINRG